MYPSAQPKPSLSVAPLSVSTHSGGGSAGASQAQHMTSELKSSSSKEPQYDERSTPSESKPVYPSAQPKPSLSVAPLSASTHSGGGSTGASQAQHMTSELKSSSSKEPQYDERSTPSESKPVYPSAQPKPSLSVAPSSVSTHSARLELPPPLARRRVLAARAVGSMCTASARPAAKSRLTPSAGGAARSDGTEGGAAAATISRDATLISGGYRAVGLIVPRSGHSIMVLLWARAGR